MDKWDDRQLAFMRAGGNKACKTFLKENDSYDLPLAQRWSSKAAQKWRDQLKKAVDKLEKRPRKSRKEVSSESEEETSEEETSDSGSELTVTVTVASKKKDQAKKAAKRSTVSNNLIEWDVGEAKDEVSAVRDCPGAGVRQGESWQRLLEALTDSKGKKKQDKVKSRSSARASEEVALDRESLDQRIQKRKEEKDREREREAIAKLEMICGTASVNPPAKTEAPDSDSDSSEDEHEKEKARRRKAKKEKEKAEKQKSKQKSGDTDGNVNPALKESTMARLRREAMEEKARKEREKQEYMEQFSGKSGISSSDFFGEDAQAEKNKRDYSNVLDGYKGDNPLTHAILHKGFFTKETATIVKDKAAEVLPEVAGKAGSVVASAASYLKENAGGWLSSAKDRMGLSGNNFSSSSGSWIDQEARRRLEQSKNASGGSMGGMQQGSGNARLEGFGSDGSARCGGFGEIRGNNTSKSLGIEELDHADLDRWLDSDEEEVKSSGKTKSKKTVESSESEDEAPKKKSSKDKKKKSKKSSRKQESDEEVASSSSKSKSKSKAQEANPLVSFDLIDLS
eukprot:752049-Hanusia_phi.AAC.6